MNKYEIMYKCTMPGFAEIPVLHTTVIEEFYGTSSELNTYLNDLKSRGYHVISTSQVLEEIYS